MLVFCVSATHHVDPRRRDAGVFSSWSGRGSGRVGPQRSRGTLVVKAAHMSPRDVNKVPMDLPAETAMDVAKLNFLDMNQG